MLQERTEIRRKISLRDFTGKGGDEAEWALTDAAKKLGDEMNAEASSGRMYQRQADRLADETGRSKHPDLRGFMRLFTTSQLGLGITSAGAGKRDTRLQSDFRQSLIDSYQCRHPDIKTNFWCPIMKEWFFHASTQAAHLFAYMHGQDLMDSIFGVMPTPELFSPLNGLLLSRDVESVFDDGFLVIVPRLPDDPSAAQISLWHSSDPKEYKVRIIDKHSRLNDEFIKVGSPRKWKHLDGTNVEFKNDFRPRARYLYFHYCVQMLRLAWRENPQGTTLKKQIGKGYWGSRGRYLPRSMLLAFIEEMGHEYDSLLDGATDDAATQTDVDSEILLATATDQIKASAVEVIEEEDEENDDEEGDDEEGDDDEDQHDEDDDDDDDKEDDEDDKDSDDEDDYENE